MKQQTACLNMLYGQLQPNGISETVLLNVIHNIPRTLFVPPKYRHFAFADMSLPLSDKSWTFTPSEEARIVTLLQPGANDTVLEVGSGSGYLTALLAAFSHHIYSVDSNPQVTQQVAKCLAGLNINNVTLVTSNAIQGWHAQPHYDIILINGSVPFIPKALCKNLAIGGRLFAVVGEAPVMEGTLLKRLDESNWEVETAFTTNQARLANPLPEALFRF